jgi:DNA gyrase subunit A
LAAVLHHRRHGLQAQDLAPAAGGRTAKGKAIVNILPIETGVSIAALMPVDVPEEDWDNLQIVFATSTATCGRTTLSDFTNVKRNGKIAMNLPEGVTLVNAAHLRRPTT